MQELCGVNGSLKLMLGGQRQEPVWPFRVSMGLASIPKKLAAFQGNLLHGTVSAVTGSQVVVGHLQWVCESLGILSLLALLVLSHAPCQHSALLFRVVGPSCSGRWLCRRGLPVQASPAFHSLPPCSIMATANTRCVARLTDQTPEGIRFPPPALSFPFLLLFGPNPGRWSQHLNAKEVFILGNGQRGGPVSILNPWSATNHPLAAGCRFLH